MGWKWKVEFGDSRPKRRLAKAQEMELRKPIVK